MEWMLKVVTQLQQKLTFPPCQYVVQNLLRGMAGDNMLCSRPTNFCLSLEGTNVIVLSYIYKNVH